MIRQRKSFSPIRPRRAAWAARCALAAALALGASVPGRAAPAAELPVLTVQAAATAQASSYDGQVEALRQSVVAAQVPGRVLELNVHAGDTVRAGQVLLRIDARAAEQSAAAALDELEVVVELVRTVHRHVEVGLLLERRHPEAEARGQLEAGARGGDALDVQPALHLLGEGVDEVVGRYYIAKHPGEYKILEENFGKEDFAVGLRMSDKAFKAELDKTLEAMKKDGTASQISKKWFGEDIITK